MAAKKEKSTYFVEINCTEFFVHNNSELPSPLNRFSGAFYGLEAQFYDVTPDELRELVELLHEHEVRVSVYPTDPIVFGVDVLSEALWTGEPSDCPEALFR